MARAHIGRMFHLSPLVDDLGDAEYFFNAVFSPMCMMRNYAEIWHRHAAIYVFADASIEPMHCLPPEPGDAPTSWFRYAERFGPRVHNIAFYADDLEELGQRLTAAGVRITDADSGNTIFCHPKDTPGMLEFHPSEGLWERLDPRFRPEWTAFSDAYWGRHHPLGLQRMSHVTVVVDDLPAAEKFYVDVLDSVPLPDQDATVPGGVSRYVVVGEDTIVELLAPGDTDSVHARDLALVGPSITGVTFTVHDLAQTATRFEYLPEFVAEMSEHEIRLDVAKTWGCEYRFTERVLAGDPRV